MESDLREELQQRCYGERMLQQRYRYYGQKRKAETMEMPYCEELAERFGGKPNAAAAAV